MKFLKYVGEFLAAVSILGILVGVILYVFFDWRFEPEYPIKLVPSTKAPEVQETETALVLVSPGLTDMSPVISPTDTVIPIDGNWVVQGNGKVVAAKDYVLVYTTGNTSIHTKDNDFHNIYLEMNIDVVRLDAQGSYSLLLRRADPCQLYNVRFSNIDEKNIEIELRKYFCSDGYKVLNRVQVAINAFEPYKLSASIVGGEVVYFSISINDVEQLKVQDTNDFIWRGDFGVSVENGEVNFLDIKVQE